MSRKAAAPKMAGKKPPKGATPVIMIAIGHAMPKGVPKPKGAPKAPKAPRGKLGVGGL